MDTFNSLSDAPTLGRPKGVEKLGNMDQYRMARAIWNLTTLAEIWASTQGHQALGHVRSACRPR